MEDPFGSSEGGASGVGGRLAGDPAGQLAPRPTLRVK